MEIFPIAIGEYRHLPPLDGIEHEVARVADALVDFGAAVLRPWDVPMSERGGDAVSDRLDGWPREGAGATILYWIGHGWSDRKSAALAHARSQKRIGKTGVAPEALAESIARWQALVSEDSWLLVVVDACKSARFVELVAAELDNLGGRRKVVLLSTSNASATVLGRLADQLELALAHTFADDPTVPVVALANELSRRLDSRRRILEVGDDAVLQRVAPIARGYQGPLDIRRELDRLLRELPEDERRHFLAKAQGGDLTLTGTLGEPTWHFKGRAKQRGEILDGLNRGGLTAVTGRAGSGKSALLGDLLVRSRSELAAFLRGRRLLKPTRHPDPPPFDSAIHLSGMPTDQVLTRLSADLQLEAPDPAAPLNQRVSRVMQQLGASQQPRRLLFDALDEAVEPYGVADVLRQLGGMRQLAVLVGTRRSTLEGPDQHDTDDDGLLEALGPMVRVDVEQDSDAVFDYVRDRLSPEQTHTSQAAVDDAARAVASIDQEFLYARLATHELLQRPELIATPDVINLLGRTHRALFRSAVDRLATEDAAFGPLLSALAVAQGRGLPVRDGVWAQVASAISRSVVTVDNAAIDRLIEATSPYLAVDREHDQTVYRLAHRTFAEHFLQDRERTIEWHRSIAYAAVEILDNTHTRIASEGADGAKERESFNPYWLHYLSAHCAEAGQDAWKRLAESRSLNELEPAAVRSDAMRSLFGSGVMPIEIASIVASAHDLAVTPTSDHWGLRQLAAARLGGQLGRRLRPESSAWTVVSSKMRRQPLHTVLAGHEGGVSSVAFGTSASRLLLASGSEDRTLRVWDASRGQPIGNPLVGHKLGVSSVAFGTTSSGRLLLASGSWDETVRLWDPITGQPIGLPLTGHSSLVTSVAFGSASDGGLVLASGSLDGTVQVWDPLIGLPIGQPLTSHTDGVTSVAFGSSSDGRLLLASGSEDRTILVWDAASGQRISKLSGHARAVSSVAFGHPRDSKIVMASGSRDRTVRVWNPLTGEPPTKTLTANADGVTSVAFASTDSGQMLVTSGGKDGTVLLWDSLTPGEPQTVLTGHTASVDAVALGSSTDGKLLLASGSRDGTVRLWDPGTVHMDTTQSIELPLGVWSVAFGTTNDGRLLLADASRYGQPRVTDMVTGSTTCLSSESAHEVSVAFGTTREGRLLLASGSLLGRVCVRDAVTGDTVADSSFSHRFAVRSVAFGTTSSGGLLLASGSWDGTTQLWNPVAGQPIGPPLDAYAGVNSVAFGNTSDGRLLLASGNQSGTVRLWDPLTCLPIGGPLSGHTEAVSSVAFGNTSKGRLLLASASRDGTVLIWDPLAGRPVKQLLTGSEATTVTFGYSAQGRLLLVFGGPDCIWIWDPEISQVVRWLPIGLLVEAAALASPDMLAVGMNDGVAVIQLNDGSIKQRHD